MDCLISLLNDALLKEVTEERTVNLLCCNVASCKNPELTDDMAKEWKAHNVRTRGKTLRDLTLRLKAA